MRVCMLVKNSFEYDARVEREAASLVAAGHAVTVVALHVPAATVRAETTATGVRVQRVSRLYGSLTRLLPGFLRASTTTPGASAPARPAGAATAVAAAGRRRGRVARVGRTLGRAGARQALAVATGPLRLANAAVVDRRMRAAAIASGADVVHAHDLNTLAAGASAARALDARLIYDAHELHTARNDVGPAAQAWAHVRERALVGRADAVITATDTWADDLAARYRLPRPVVVRNLPLRADERHPWDLRTRLGIDADEAIVLYQGSIQRNRGIEQVIDALPALPGAVLVVVGYGAHRPTLEELVAVRGLAARVRFDGPVPSGQLIDYSAGADVGTCLIRNSSRSYHTSLPNKLFEYIQAGVPVVASDFPEMGPLVRGEGVGEVADPDEPAAVAAAVRRILDQPAAYTDALADAAARLHWHVVEPRLLAVYEAL